MSNSLTKKWVLMTKISEKEVNDFLEINPVFLQLLFNRNLKTRQEIDNYLFCDFEQQIHNPFLFKDMKEAVELIIKHLKKSQRIVIYGDYDVDGVTSTAILYETLKVFNGQVDFYIPDRVSEGYGLNKEAIDEIAEKKAKLIITVDNGIRHKEEIAYLKNKGIDIILTDHHVPPENKAKLPECLIINPMADDAYPFKYLSGAGVAYKLACALIKKAKLPEKKKSQMVKNLLDLAALGTVADCVPLIGENRILVKYGLEVINKKKRLGLKKLIEISSVKNEIDSWNIGFQLGPRLNAAGRMDTAIDAFHLLVTKDEQEAEKLADNLNKKNQARQQATNEAFAQAEKQLRLKDNFLVAVNKTGDQSWNEGIIGLVAGKITEKHYKPTLVILKNKDEYKGSGRSIDEFNIIKAVEQCKEWLEKYGGHAAACGFALKKENLDLFIKKIKKIADEELKNTELKPKIKIEAEAPLSEINLELIKQIEKLGPFGQDNEKPKLLSRGCLILNITNMGNEKQHIKIKIKENNSNALVAIGFGQTEKWEDLKVGGMIDIVYYTEINNFNGREEAQLKIIDIKNNND